MEMRKALGRNLVSGREILLSLFFWVGLLEKMEIYTPLKYSEKGGKSLTSLMISGKTFSRPPLLRYFLSKCFFFSLLLLNHTSSFGRQKQRVVNVEDVVRPRAKMIDIRKKNLKRRRRERE